MAQYEAGGSGSRKVKGKEGDGAKWETSATAVAVTATATAVTVGFRRRTSVVFTFAPFATSTFTTSVWPSIAAMLRGVLPVG